MNLRKKLQAGVGRTPASGLALALIGWLIIKRWDYFTGLTANPLEVVQKVAFVAAAFSVTTYNLRTRVIDFILKIESTPHHVKNLCVIARTCGKRLTNLVLLHTAAALMMASGGFIKPTHIIAPWYCAFSMGLFAAAIVQFVYVLFAFERLETYMLDEAEEKARQKEVKKLTGT